MFSSAGVTGEESACKFTGLRAEFTSCGCRTEGFTFLLSDGACGGETPSAPRGFTQFPETASSGFLTLPCGLHSDGHLLH